MHSHKMRKDLMHVIAEETVLSFITLVLVGRQPRQEARR